MLSGEWEYFTKVKEIIKKYDSRLTQMVIAYKITGNYI